MKKEYKTVLFTLVGNLSLVQLFFVPTASMGAAAPIVTGTVVYCQNATPSSALTAIAGSGNTLNWYTVSTGGTASPTAPTPSTTTVGLTTYYVSQTDNLGSESNRASILVSVKANPTVIPKSRKQIKKEP